MHIYSGLLLSINIPNRVSRLFKIHTTHILKCKTHCIAHVVVIREYSNLMSAITTFEILIVKLIFEWDLIVPLKIPNNSAV